jgi:hypothetical protein
MSAASAASADVSPGEENPKSFYLCLEGYQWVFADGDTRIVNSFCIKGCICTQLHIINSGLIYVLIEDGPFPILMYLTLTSNIGEELRFNPPEEFRYSSGNPFFDLFITNIKDSASSPCENLMDKTPEINSKKRKHRMEPAPKKVRDKLAIEIEILSEINDKDASNFNENLQNIQLWTLFFLTNNISSQQPRTKEDVTQNYTYVKLEPCQKKVEEEVEVEVKKARLEQDAGSKKYKKRKTNKRRRINKRRTIKKNQRRQKKSRK